MDSEEEDERKSRTQLKREFEEVKELARQLVELKPAQLQAVPISDRTREAAEAAQSMSRSALTRQLRYVTGLLDDEDVDAIRRAIADAQKQHAADVTTLHVAERWRDELIADGDKALQRLLDEYPVLDRQHLSQLVRNARKERERGKPPASARQLFRYLRGVMSDGA